MNQNGLSLIELLIVVVSVGMMVLLIANIPSSITLINKSRHQSIAREVASKVIEDTRATTYTNLANGVSQIVDSRLSSLPSSSATKDIEDCSQQVCTNDELAKELTVSVYWSEAGNSVSYTIKTLIASGGLGQ